MTRSTLTLKLPSADDTDRFGQTLATIAKPGDCILLRGQIGAGKSALARAFIRARLGEETDVPSPTFTLVQTYDDPICEIWHSDLYRLGDTQEAVELGLIDAMETEICIIEWPEIIDELAPETSLNITLCVLDDHHTAELVFNHAWTDRLKESLGDA